MVLAKHADSMLRERDRLLTDVNELSRRLEIQKATIEDIEKKRMDLENKNKELCKILDVSLNYFWAGHSQSIFSSFLIKLFNF